jgi:hypothetical protein
MEDAMYTATLTAVVTLGVTLSMAGGAEEAATAEFLALETKLLAAAQLRNDSVLDPMVSPDFAYSLALEGRSNYVLNRSEWFRGSEYYDLKQFQISRLTAHLLGKTALTSFRMETSTGVGGKDMSGAYVVIDVWSGGPGRWRLVRRFVSRPVSVPAK